jgi:hypothetical protein
LSILEGENITTFYGGYQKVQPPYVGTGQMSGSGGYYKNRSEGDV